ncbi:hypothetical protein ACSTKY_13175 [Vibrio parahaemolyticus]|uniref:hypothetical protein n=1 Tax=Vibrio diabolicus TaxID=50719 RepID=UPI0031CCF06D
MTIKNLSDAIALQAEINVFLAKEGIKDLVGDYGELLVYKALGGTRENAVNQGFDISHLKYGRIEVKTRKYELLETGKVRKENRAVGFKGKEGGFDWLAHVILDTNFKVVSACLAPYNEVWPEVQRTKDKIGYSTSSKLPSSIDITNEVRTAQSVLGFGI